MTGIVILNYNRYDLTMRCVKSIDESGPGDHCVVIVENGSGNDSWEQLTNAYSGREDIVLLQTGENLGYSKGNNVGIAYLKDKGIHRCVLTNSDIVFGAGAIERMVSELDDRTVICGPKIHDAQGNIQHSTLLRKNTFWDLIEVGRLFPKKRLDEAGLTGVEPVYSVSGCCFAVNIDLFQEMGALDEHLFLYCEEMILGLQCQQKGYRCVFAPEAVVIHNHGGSTDRNPYFGYQCYIRSLLYYLRTWEHYGPVRIGCVKAAFLLKIRLKHIRGFDREAYRGLVKVVRGN